MDYINLFDITLFFLHGILIRFIFIGMIFWLLLHKNSTKKEIALITLFVSIMASIGGIIDKLLNAHMKRLIELNTMNAISIFIILYIVIYLGVKCVDKSMGNKLNKKKAVIISLIVSIILFVIKAISLGVL